MIRRSALTKVLADALADGTVQHRSVRPGACDDRRRRAGHAVGLRPRARPRAVVGADGTRSVVARHLNGALADRYVGYTAWRGVADYSIDPDVAGEVLGPGIEFGHVPLGSDRTYWFATERAPEGTSRRRASSTI